MRVIEWNVVELKIDPVTAYGLGLRRAIQEAEKEVLAKLPAHPFGRWELSYDLEFDVTRDVMGKYVVEAEARLVRDWEKRRSYRKAFRRRWAPYAPR